MTIYRRTATMIASTLLGLGCFAGSAQAYTDAYGPAGVANGGHVESSGAHTFFINHGSNTAGYGTMACQIFQKSGGSYNFVGHGDGACSVGINAGIQYAWARVYNQAGYGRTISGHAVA